ncbi:uncharacterized protein LOC143460623 [Clavelina lepadiformis]|uniref:Uncharacterized protein n=1 Tax=Clavelina lepadiformis TaxID=159417 RepID=A0ABP0GEW1_CLALP
MLAILKIDKLSRIQTEANDLLQGAVISERGQSWNKVAEKYKKMLKLISKSNLPASFVAPPTYNMLLYESYYHLGIALQNLGRHRESVHAYSSAMMSMNLRKNGCMAGCNSNTCFQTPVLAKRAFAYAKTGDIKNAFRDIEKAVVLDTHNPDLYCVRAILWNSRKEPQKALEDLNRALTFKPSHVCALILRGTIDQPMQMSFGLLEGISINYKKEIPEDHKMAVKFNPDASDYFDVNDVHNQKVIKFWNRFLWSLNIPRTVTHVDLMSNVLAQYNTTVALSDQFLGPDFRSTPATPLVPNRNQNPPITSYDIASDGNRPKSMPAAPFRCGTPYGSDDGPTNRARRLSYGEAIRTYTAKRQDTGVSEYIQRLVAHASRPTTAKSSKSSQHEQNTMPTISVTIKSPARSPMVSLLASRKSSVSFEQRASPVTTTAVHQLHAPTINPPFSRRGSKISVASCPIPYNHQSKELAEAGSVSPGCVSKRRSSIAVVRPKHKEAAKYASTVHGMQVFQSVNLSDAPRMYYKPWGGDKLPVAELSVRKKVEAFRV